MPASSLCLSLDQNISDALKANIDQKLGGFVDCSDGREDYRIISLSNEKKRAAIRPEIAKNWRVFLCTLIH